VSCYHDPTFEIHIEAKKEDLNFFGAIAALVELLSYFWGAMFRIAARFNTRGGDALSPLHLSSKLKEFNIQLLFMT
jgi:hypothetical protein